MNNFKKGYAPVNYDPSSVSGTAVSLSNQNCTVSTTSTLATTNNSVWATEGRIAGKWYWEVKLDRGDCQWLCVTMETSSNSSLSWDNYLIGYRTNGGMTYTNGTATITDYPVAEVGDIIGIALDMENKTVQYYLNGVKINVTGGITEAIKAYPGIWSSQAGISTITTTTTNFGAEPFVYPIPEGFLPYDVSKYSKLSLLLENEESAQLSLTHQLGDNNHFNWSCQDELICTIDDQGRLTAISEGRTYVIVQHKYSDYEDVIFVKVVGIGEARSYRLAIHLLTRESEKLHYDDERDVTWTSLDPNVAIIDSTGRVTGLSSGLALIQAECSGEAETIYVRVNE